MNKGYKKFNRKEGLVVEEKKFNAGVPTREKVSTGSELLDYKAFRDLAFTGAIEPKADPNTEVARGSYPYAILNRTNRVVEGKYPGYDNIAGNSLVRLQNSVTSQFLNLFDSGCMIKRLNYNYLAYHSDDPNPALNVEMVKAFDQALSYGYSTMLTQLPFYTDKVNTDLPRIGSYVGQSSDSYDKMGALLHYQIVQQNIISPLSKYTELLSLEEDLMNMSYRRESPLIQEIFGQLKKKAFVAQLNAIGTTVIGEYLDVNWWKQMNALRHIPSRRANCMHDPILTTVTTHYIPRLKLYAGQGDSAVLYYDSHDNDHNGLFYNQTGAAANFLDPEDFVEKTYSSLDLETAVLNISKLLDPHYLLTWCRKRNSGTLASGAIQHTSAYYQGIVKYCQAINFIASRFVSCMTEIRTFLDKLADSGMVYWKKGMAFDIGRINPVPLTYNQIVADVFKATMAGAHTIYFDAGTQRWVCNTEWNMYLGISEYDKKSGGSFLTFSLRNVSLTDSAGNTIAKTSSCLLIPCLFSAQPKVAFPTASTGHEAAGIRFVTRLGFLTWIQSKVIVASDITSNTVLSRLNPLDNTSLSIKAPNWYIPSGLSGNEKAHIISALHKVLVQVAGYDRITPTASTVDSSCDPDLLCFVDLQIEDVSNAMIQYARNYSPFRVNTPNPERTMGFGG